MRVLHGAPFYDGFDLQKELLDVVMMRLKIRVRHGEYVIKSTTLCIRFLANEKCMKGAAHRRGSPEQIGVRPTAEPRSCRMTLVG
jgi:hypothetical protein